MGRRAVATAIFTLLFGSLGAAGEVLRVPQDFPTIQGAVDAALPGDAVSIAPGTYWESVRIDSKDDLLLLGELTLSFEVGAPCWDAVAAQAATVVISGSITIHSSRRIAIEGLTITGPGPGVRIEGTPAAAAMDVTIRYCNLVYNDGAGVEIVGEYHRLAVVCTNDLHNRMWQPPLSDPGSTEPGSNFIACLRTHAASAESVSASPVVVAVIDSGIDRTIPVLSCHAWVNEDEIPANGLDDDHNAYVDDVYGWDFRDGDADSLHGSPIHQHGTFVAGVLIEAFETRAGAVGEQMSLRVMDLRFLSSEALFYLSDWGKLSRAIDYAVANGARIINLSIYATRVPPDFVREAVRRAVAQGVLVVAIAGNDAGHLGPIADWAEVLTVGAATEAGSPARFSNFGDELDLMAYGVDVLSLLPQGALGQLSGTSYAAPYVAGLAAFQLAMDAQLSVEDVEAILRAAAIDIGVAGYDSRSGWGLIR